jgi:hypothetical protein
MQFIMEDNIETALIEVFQIVFMHNQPSPVIPQNFLSLREEKILWNPIWFSFLNA